MGGCIPLQQAFLDEGAMQCAYCTSGMIITGVALLKSNPAPSDAEIVEYMQGNVCRCGTYPRIVAAVRGAARAMKNGTPAAGAAKGERAMSSRQNLFNESQIASAAAQRVSPPIEVERYELQLPSPAPF